MRKFNILIFSGGRSDFDLLLPVIKKLKKYKFINTSLIVTGSHLSKKHGLTLQYVKSQNLRKVIPININCENVTEKNLPLVFSRAQKLYSEYLFNLKQQVDLSIVLGDRYEALAFASACFFSNIPLAHIHGGEKTKGSKDDTIRHAITKFSNIHFVSNNEHRQRVLQLGENNRNIFICGLLGYENIRSIKLIKKKSLEKILKINLNKQSLLISYHSVTTISKTQNIKEFKSLLFALKKYKKLNIIFTSPNIDPGNSELIKLINKFIKQNTNAYFFSSLGQKIFFSLAKLSNIFLGNSSSGVLEIPFLDVPVINIGERQSGRYQFIKVLNIAPNKNKVIKSIDLILSKKIKTNYPDYNMKNNASSLIVKNIIKKLKDNKNIDLKNKTFSDINF